MQKFKPKVVKDRVKNRIIYLFLNANTFGLENNLIELTSIIEINTLKKEEKYQYKCKWNVEGFMNHIRKKKSAESL